MGNIFMQRLRKFLIFGHVFTFLTFLNVNFNFQRFSIFVLVLRGCPKICINADGRITNSITYDTAVFFVTRLFMYGAAL